MKCAKRAGLAFLLLFVMFTFAYAVDTWTQFANYTDVTAIARHRETLWVGASSAIISYNVVSGQKIIYDKMNSPVNYCTVYDIVITEDNTVWFATNIGLYSLRGAVWTLYDTVPAGNSPGFRCMIADSQGALWLGSYTEGLFKFDGTTWTNYNTANSPLPSNNVRTFGMDDSLTIWVATYASAGGSRLTKLVAGAWETWNSSSTTFYPNVISAIAFTSTGNMWLGQHCCGVTYYDGTTWTHYAPYSSPLPDSYVDDLTVDANDVLWVAVDKCNVASFNGIEWTVYSFNTSYPNAILADADDNIWCGFNDTGGLYKMSQGEWRKIDLTTCNGVRVTGSKEMTFSSRGDLYATNTSQIIHFNQLTWESATAREMGVVQNLGGGLRHLTLDRDENLWFSAFYGWDDCQLIKYDGALSISYNRTNSPLMTGEIRGVSAAPDGSIWIIKSNKIYRLDGSTWTQYSNGEIPCFTDSSVNISCSPDGKVYLLTQSKLHVFDDGTWSTVSLGNVYACDMFLDGDNALWITGTHTFFKYENATLTTWNSGNTPGMPTISFYSIAVDAQGNVWLGTNSGKLFKKDHTQWIEYNSSNSPISSYSILDLALDNQDNLWVSTGFALCKLTFGNEAVTDNQDSTPVVHSELACYPNPFRTGATISYKVAQNSPVSVNIYNLKGQLTRRLYAGTKSAGNYILDWDGCNDLGSPVQSGMYIIRMQAGADIRTAKILRQ